MMITLIMLAVALFVAGNILLIFYVIKKIGRGRSAEIMSKFEGREVLFTSRGAQYFGRKSSGLMQIRGNGDLIITPEEVYFEMWFPKRVFRTPLSSLIAVETPRFFNGRSVFMPLLKLTFHSETGGEDAVGWYVKDLEKAIAVLRPHVTTDHRST
ncbi:MAG: hypothetical protein ACE5OP_10170 [Candidatus Glassbacteria bacterium]